MLAIQDILLQRMQVSQLLEHQLASDVDLNNASCVSASILLCALYLGQAADMQHYDLIASSNHKHASYIDNSDSQPAACTMSWTDN